MSNCPFLNKQHRNIFGPTFHLSSDWVSRDEDQCTNSYFHARSKMLRRKSVACGFLYTFPFFPKNYDNLVILVIEPLTHSALETSYIFEIAIGFFGGFYDVLLKLGLWTDINAVCILLKIKKTAAFYSQDTRENSM